MDANHHQTYYQRNKGRILKRQAEYYEKNKERISGYWSAIPEEHKAKRVKSCSTWKRKNVDKTRESQRKASLVHRSQLKNRLLINAMKRVSRRTKLLAPIKELLGCDAVHLLEHIRTRYKPQMTDENYGEWVIDHIKPLCAYDLTKLENQKIVCHYTNLQPLWDCENAMKALHKDKNYQPI